MTQKICLICLRAHPAVECEVFALTADQEATLIKKGITALPDEFVYCRNCWRLVGHPEIGPKLMRDMAERQMLKVGVTPPKAQQLADKYFSRLVQLKHERDHHTH